MGETKLRAYLDPGCSEELLSLFAGSDRWDLVRAKDIGADSAPPKEQLETAEGLKRLLITRDGGFLDETGFPIRDCPAGVVVFEAVPGGLGALEGFLDEIFGKLDYYYRRLKVTVTDAGFRASSVSRDGKARSEFHKW